MSDELLRAADTWRDNPLPPSRVYFTDEIKAIAGLIGRLAIRVRELEDALAATDHLYYDDGDVRTCYEYDDNQKAWEAMAAARAALGDRHD